jgi:hypothetical protein
VKTRLYRSITSPVALPLNQPGWQRKGAFIVRYTVRLVSGALVNTYEPANTSWPIWCHLGHIASMNYHTVIHIAPFVIYVWMCVSGYKQ